MAQDKSPSSILVLLVAACGALAPEVCRLYQAARRGRLRIPTNTISYIFLSLIYAGLGGVIAIVLPAENLNVAFYVGATTDVTVSRLLKASPQPLEAANAGNAKPSVLKRVKWAIQDHAGDL
jgi:hypothetical protein